MNEKGPEYLMTAVVVVLSSVSVSEPGYILKLLDLPIRVLDKRLYERRLNFQYISGKIALSE